MSGAPTPTGRPAKPMSSRLMTMKFMQRAASSAAAASSLPTRPSSTSSQKHFPTPSSSSPPSSFHPSKRHKTSSSFAPNSSSSLSSMTPHSELQAIQEALAAEEAKRSQALERQAAEAGRETKWVLSTADSNVGMGGFVVGAGMTGERGMGLCIRRMGYSEIEDASSEEDGDGDGKSHYASGISTSAASNMMGRRSFGKFNRELEKRSRSTASPSSSDAATPEDSDDDDATALIRASRPKKNPPPADAAAAAQDVHHLNRLSSISGGSARAASNPNTECYGCGRKGHVRKNCPENPYAVGGGGGWSAGGGGGGWSAGGGKKRQSQGGGEQGGKRARVG